MSSMSLKGPGNSLDVRAGEDAASEIPGIYIHDVNCIKQESLLLTGQFYR